MADVANSVPVSSPQSGGNKGHPLEPESPDISMLSPGVQEAMNRIFSNSTSLLSEMASSEIIEGSTNTLIPNGSGEENAPLCSGEANAVSNLTKTDVNARAVSPIVPKEASPVIPNSEHPSINKLPSTNILAPSDKKQSAKGRISKADLEVITSLQQNFDNSSQSSNCVEDLASDGFSEATSDSEDMCRPFATAAKERKKDSKKKKKKSKSVDKVSVLDMGGDSEEEFQNSKRSRKTRNDVNLNETHLKQRVVMKALEEESISWKDVTKKTSNYRRKSSETDTANDNINATTETVNTSSGVGEINFAPQSSEMHLSNNVASMLNDSSKIDNLPGGGDISNCSTSSAKENLPCSLPCKAYSGIKLPKVKKTSYHISDEKNIEKTFPRCYVVVKSLGFIRSWCKLSHWTPLEAVLPLSVRIDFLKKKCDRGSLKCRKKKKRKQKEIFLPASPMIEAGQSEEEFVPVSRGGRSLRKRNQKISYKEPSEFMIEFRDEDSSSKKSKNRSKSPDWTPDSDDEDKKRKNKVNQASGENTSKENNYLNQNYSGKKDASGRTEVVVYPHGSREQKQFQSWEEQRSDKNKTTMPSRYVPVVSNSSSFRNSSSYMQAGTIANSLVPQMPIGYPANTVPQGNRPNVPMMVQNSGQTTVSSFPQMTAPATSKQPQYCMMKMDGKDVLVQLVPSGVSGQVPQGMQSVVLQGGKRFLIAPPAGMQGALSQPRIVGQPAVRRGPVPGPTQIAYGPISSNNRLLSTTTLSTGTMMNTPVIRNNISMLSSAPLTGLTGISIGQNFSLGTTGGLSSVSTTMSTNVSSPYILTSRTPVSASLRPSSNLTSMAAPNSTAVVQGVRALGSNLRFPVVSTQAGNNNLTQVRVFVPGCTVTGTRGHYSTLNAISGSPLTRLSASSQLLPERKRTAENALTPEQKAAKRRRLEKKYPLPPGVVIKTEPDSPPPSAAQSNPGMRSLLGGQNVSIIPSRGAGVRILTPTLANSLQNRAVRPGSNIMYRAASVGRGQTVLVPLSLNSTAPTSTVTPVIPSSTSISSFTTATTLTPSIPTCSVSATVSTTAPSTTTSTLSVASVTQSTNVSSNSSLPATDSQSNNLHKSNVNLPPPSSNNASRISSHNQDSSCAELEKLRKLVLAQEALGLKGQRLDKLKTLLRQKEKALEIQQSSMVSVSTSGSRSGTPVSNAESISAVDVNGFTGTMEDPFVID